MEMGVIRNNDWKGRLVVSSLSEFIDLFSLDVDDNIETFAWDEHQFVGEWDGTVYDTERVRATVAEIIGLRDRIHELDTDDKTLIGI